MDPQICLVEMLEAFRDQDRDTAIERCENLLDWLNKGGFMPTIGYENGYGSSGRFGVYRVN